MNVSVAKQQNVTHDLSLIVIEGYIAMINSTDKISTRVSCSIVVVSIVFTRCFFELRHKLVALFLRVTILKSNYYS
jgi:hypothetical protein